MIYKDLKLFNSKNVVQNVGISADCLYDTPSSLYDTPSGLYDTPSGLYDTLSGLSQEGRGHRTNKVISEVSKIHHL